MLTRSDLLEAEVRQVGENDAPLVIADVGATPGRRASQSSSGGAVRGVILHPVRTADHVIAILAVFFAKPCGSQEVP